jgi:peptidoglycan/xylan/chitin deacetylase (PgdA/CDA1 family)
LLQKIPDTTAESVSGTPGNTEVDFGHPLPTHVAAHIVWGGAYATRARTQAEETTTLFPVFAYHRTGRDSPESLKEYCLDPDDFEQQLRYLRRRGYYSIKPDQLYPQKYGAWHIQGRPLVLTFDDAYLDFFETAWPILQRNGFAAHIFVPTAHVGKTAAWDSEYGPAAPLMDWDHIRHLSAQGVTFGSHLARHRDSRKLSFTELLEEAIVSKKILEKVLDCPVNTVAPPFASYGPREVKILRIAGYDTIFGTETGGFGATGQVVIPRFFVDGRKDINAFSEYLGEMVPPPDDYDLHNKNFKTIFSSPGLNE